MVTLIIDAGHGGKDRGGGNSKNFYEKDKALQITLYQFQRLKELGVSVVLTRSKDEYLTWKPRTDRVKNSGATYCISNHINSGGGHGAEIIHSIFDQSKLPRMMMDELKKVGIKERRIFTKKNNAGLDWYYMNRETGKVKTYIIEYGFADNPIDEKIIHIRWKELAEAVIKAFCEFIRVEYKPPKPQKGEHDWKKDAVKWMYDEGLLTGDQWMKELEKPLPLWAEAIVLKRLYEKMKKG